MTICHLELFTNQLFFVTTSLQETLKTFFGKQHQPSITQRLYIPIAYSINECDEDRKEENSNGYGITTAEEKGLAIGEARGRAQERTEIARNLKRQGLHTAVIAEATGLRRGN